MLFSTGVSPSRVRADRPRAVPTAVLCVHFSALGMEGRRAVLGTATGSCARRNIHGIPKTG